MAGQRFQCPVISGFPKVDKRPAAVIFPACAADAKFLRIANQGLPVLHVLCYTVHAGMTRPFGRIVFGNLILTDVSIPVSIFSPTVQYVL